MAFFDESLLLNGQASLSGGLTKGEFNYNEPIVTKLLLANQNVCAPTWESLKTGTNRAFQIDFFTRTERALTSGFGYSHTYSHGATQKITPSFNIWSDGFAITKKQADRSTRSLQEMYNNEMRNTILNFTKGIEDKLIDLVIAGRDKVGISVEIDGTFNATNDVFQITESSLGDQAMFVALARAERMGYDGDSFDVLLDTVAYRKFFKQMNQGAGNATNLSYQFSMGNTTFWHIPTLYSKMTAIDAGYSNGSFIVIPKDTVACLDWTPSLNRTGDDSKVARFGAMINPINGLEIGTHETEAGTDSTTLGGDTQDVAIDTQFTAHISFVKAPSSVTDKSTIYAYSFV